LRSPVDGLVVRNAALVGKMRVARSMHGRLDTSFDFEEPCTEPTSAAASLFS
jgi:hypothetical protein